MSSMVLLNTLLVFLKTSECYLKTDVITKCVEKKQKISNTILDPFLGKIFLNNFVVTNLRILSRINDKALSSNSRHKHAIKTSMDFYDFFNELFPSSVHDLVYSNSPHNFNNIFMEYSPNRRRGIRLLAETVIYTLKNSHITAADSNSNVKTQYAVFIEKFNKKFGYSIFSHCKQLKIIIIHAFIVYSLNNEEDLDFYLNILDNYQKAHKNSNPKQKEAQDLQLQSNYTNDEPKESISEDPNTFEKVLSNSKSAPVIDEISDSLIELKKILIEKENNSTYPAFINLCKSKNYHYYSSIDKKYHDDAEITILNLLNCLLYNQKNKKFETLHLKLNENHPLNRFYRTHNSPFVIDDKIRKEWNDVLEEINKMYSKQMPHPPIAMYYIDEKEGARFHFGIINLINIIKKITSNELQIGDIRDFSDTPVNDIFLQLLNAIKFSSELVIKLEYSKIKKVQLFHNNEDFFGELRFSLQYDIFTPIEITFECEKDYCKLTNHPLYEIINIIEAENNFDADLKMKTDEIEKLKKITNDHGAYISRKDNQIKILKEKEDVCDADTKFKQDQIRVSEKVIRFSEEIIKECGRDIILKGNEIVKLKEMTDKSGFIMMKYKKIINSKEFKKSYSIIKFLLSEYKLLHNEESNSPKSRNLLFKILCDFGALNFNASKIAALDYLFNLMYPLNIHESADSSELSTSIIQLYESLLHSSSGNGIPSYYYFFEEKYHRIYERMLKVWIDSEYFVESSISDFWFKSIMKKDISVLSLKGFFHKEYFKPKHDDKKHSEKISSLFLKFSNFKRLSTLELSENCLENYFDPLLNTLKGFKWLETLYLSRCQLSGKLLVKLLNSIRIEKGSTCQNSRLRHLSIDNNRLCNKDLKPILDVLSAFKRLSYLDISNNSFDWDGMKMILRKFMGFNREIIIKTSVFNLVSEEAILNFYGYDKEKNTEQSVEILKPSEEAILNLKRYFKENNAEQSFEILKLSEPNIQGDYLLIKIYPLF